MLTEITQVQQRPDEPRRRWFRSDSLDLVVWFGEGGAILGFQLCYDRRGVERAITWFEGKGYAHHRIDDGEEHPPTYKRAPILLSAGEFDWREVTQDFEREAENLPAEVLALVAEKLQAQRSS